MASPARDPAASEGRTPESSPPPPDGGGWGSRKALEVLALAFVFPVTVYVGFAAGRWLGARLGDAGTGGVVGLVVGAAAAFWELYEYVRRLAPK